MKLKMIIQQGGDETIIENTNAFPTDIVLS